MNGERAESPQPEAEAGSLTVSLHCLLNPGASLSLVNVVWER